jgi:hypothetical protein
MIHLTPQTPIILATAPVDFRKQIDGLVALCRNQLKVDSRNGTRIVFINRARSMIRILTYDENGYWIATKRLSQGRFRGWPKRVEDLSPVEASLLMKIIKAED